MKKQLTLPELQAQYAHHLTEPWVVNPKGSWVDLGNDWYSTCKPNPEKGSIFQDVHDGALVSFTNKYGTKLHGIVVEYYYDTQLKNVTFTVMSTEIGYEGQSNRYGHMKLRSVKILKGEINLPEYTGAKL